MEKNVKSSKRLTIVAAFIAIALCLASIVGGTLALFSADVSVSNNVLQAGNLNVKLERVSLQSTYLADNGVLVEGREIADSPAKNFTNTSDNVFGLSDTDVIVPCSKYVAKMRLTNTGSVAFDFTASLQITDNDAKKLSEQLVLKLYDLSGNELTGGVVYAGANNTFDFKVVLEFKNLATNNAVMDAGSTVNLKIACTQKTQA